MSQSDVLAGFYKDWLDWCSVKGSFRYHPQDGLCACLAYYYHKNFGNNRPSFAPYKNELIQQFIDAGLNSAYPFETEAEFWRSSDKRTNPNRMEWVKNHASV